MKLTKSMFYTELQGITWISDKHGELLQLPSGNVLCSFRRDTMSASYPIDDNQVETVPCAGYQYFLSTVVANIYGPPFSESMIHTWTFEQVGWFLVDRIGFNLVSDPEGDIHVIGAKGKTMMIYSPANRKVADCVSGKVKENIDEQVFYRFVMAMLDKMLETIASLIK